MSATVRRLLDEILSLAEDERVEIADGIWQSLGEASQEEMHFNHSMSDPEFRAEIERRSDEVHAHPEKLIPWEEVKAQLAQRQAERKLK